MLQDPTLVSNFTTPSIDSEALQIAALSQTLSCIKKIKAKDIPLGKISIFSQLFVHVYDLYVIVM